MALPDKHLPLIHYDTKAEYEARVAAMTTEERAQYNAFYLGFVAETREFHAKGNTYKCGREWLWANISVAQEDTNDFVNHACAGDTLLLSGSELVLITSKTIGVNTVVVTAISPSGERSMTFTTSNNGVTWQPPTSIVTNAFVKASEVSPYIIPNTIVRRDGNSVIAARFFEDDQGLLYAMPFSSDEDKAECDYVLQEKITDLEDIREGATAGKNAMPKPVTQPHNEELLMWDNANGSVVGVGFDPYGIMFKGDPVTDLSGEITAARQIINRRTTNNGGIVRDNSASIKALYGNSVVWNQLVDTNTTSVTLTANHIYVTSIGGIITRQIPLSNTTISVDATTDKVTDLTKMFGEGNEPATVDEFYQQLPIGIDLNAYNEGTLVNLTSQLSMHSTAFNLWDETYQFGFWNGVTYVKATNSLCTKVPISCVEGENYYIRLGDLTSYPNNVKITFLNSEGALVSELRIYNNKTPITAPDNAVCFHVSFGSDYGTEYNNDICVNVYDASLNGLYLPYAPPSTKNIDLSSVFTNGLRKLNTIRDEFIYNPNKKLWLAKKANLAMVDLGTLTWAVVASANAFRATLTGIKTALNYDTAGNILHPLYKTTYLNDVLNQTSDRCVAVHSGSALLYIRDTSYTDAASFKAAMSGIIMMYETSDEPTIEELPYFDSFYNAYQNGVEEIMSDNPSTPLIADIAYQYDAKGRVQYIYSKISSL